TVVFVTRASIAPRRKSARACPNLHGVTGGCTLRAVMNPDRAHSHSDNLLAKQKFILTWTARGASNAQSARFSRLLRVTPEHVAPCLNRGKEISMVRWIGALGAALAAVLIGASHARAQTLVSTPALFTSTGTFACAVVNLLTTGNIAPTMSIVDGATGIALTS